MKHLQSISDQNGQRSLYARATGRFYTPEAVGRPLAKEIALILSHRAAPSELAIADPFAGDGRLIAWLIEECARIGLTPPSWHVELWDLDKDALARARKLVSAALVAHACPSKVHVKVGDSFSRALKSRRFDVVITNPPWERLKPDSREVEGITAGASESYRSDLLSYDQWLGERYPLSRPKKKFSGWGTNLARVGVEAALRLTGEGGLTAIVSPPSLMADHDSVALRREIMTRHTLEQMDFFPAEARLFEGVDQPVLTFIARATHPKTVQSLVVRAHDRQAQQSGKVTLSIERDALAVDEFRLPVGFGISALDLLPVFAELPRFDSLESTDDEGLWAGREIDETRLSERLVAKGGSAFVKGKHVSRWALQATNLRYDDPRRKLPPSIQHVRLAWRDVSRPSQRRRVQATLIPAGYVTGNSVSVAYFRDDDMVKLVGLLGVMNSLVFEFQVRARLATGHVSLSSVRGVRIPPVGRSLQVVAELATARMGGDLRAAASLEVEVARAYGLTQGEFRRIADCFDLSDVERSSLDQAWLSSKVAA